MAGKVMFLRYNQSGRLDGNESVAESFRSDLVGFKSWSGRIIGAFYSLLRLPEKPSSREAHSLPEEVLGPVAPRDVFTRRPKSGHPQQTSRREARHIVRNSAVQPTASSTAIQAQVAPSLRAAMFSRTKRRRLAEGHLGSQRLLPQDYLCTVTALPWPARSPHLSPIEHIWNHLGRRVRYLTSLNELDERLQQIWNEMSQDILRSLYASKLDPIASR
ncbi:transposable element Tcb1 transposase [Trichonephila clavipes]|nr:transposable element Tcb1 transposase [Trichonephila clavipes]